MTALVAPDAGFAAYARVDDGTIRYTAAAGEVNSVEVIVSLSGTRINDAGVAITAGPGCAPIRPGSVFCRWVPNDPLLVLAIGTGDGDDSIVGRDLSSSGAQPTALWWAGGDGDDFLQSCITRADWRSYFSGGRGNDRIRECLDGLLSFGRVVPPNEIHGGPGNDRLIGGSDSDRLFGEEGSDVLFGEGGADKLRGGAGPDRLIGGAGRDALRGGAGRDLLSARDGRRDELFGGPQRDRARIDWRRDLVSGVEVFL